jgi:transcriptional regulator with XRE-family HTH domain
MIDNYSFRDTLRKWEHISGLSGREVCRRSDIPYTTYQNYKNEWRDVNPSIDNIKKIARVFNISTDELLGVDNVDRGKAFEEYYRFNTERFYKKLCTIINKELSSNEITEGLRLRVYEESGFMKERREKASAANE